MKNRIFQTSSSLRDFSATALFLIIVQAQPMIAHNADSVTAKQ